MFKNNFVVAIKVDGKILKETKDLIYLPFGTEYSILLKNLDTRNVSIDVSVDGKDVLDGRSVVIRPEKQMQLNGFYKGFVDNIRLFETQNRFRFIEKTSIVSAYGEEQIDDSILRVEFTYEARYPEYEVLKYYHYPFVYIPRRAEPVQSWEGPIITYYSDNTGDDNVGNNQQNVMSSDNYVDNNQYYDSNNLYMSEEAANQKGIYTTTTDFNEEGITVKGSPIKGHLQSNYIGELEENSSVIILRMKGVKKNSTKVEKPLAVKVMCDTCGRICRNANYCPECGTCLI